MKFIIVQIQGSKEVPLTTPSVEVARPQKTLSVQRQASTLEIKIKGQKEQEGGFKAGRCEAKRGIQARVQEGSGGQK